ncbi:O-antigen/teichoic acid export membrane protein [Spinactinospora alkalitolerans]|uniref:O-antigen/teichoic acid export membrane protein n=1 Tax=Spinactinospora alkalitolerans TaxID=687207 RepID=A0A852TNK0_9ACTN|nr:lipopolysaccharide biosynthesis protein [Spinactinospora alkalitolerans]NYE45549.1 O-antigen/teichoic acid export membrane protein [Spinactinospora alkalitolerans]
MSRRDSVGLGRVARGGAVNMAGAVIGAALNVGLVIAVTRAFSQETAGAFFSATSVFLIVLAVANLGTSNGVVYFVARLRTLGAAGLVPRVLRLAFGPVVAVSLALSCLMLASAGALAEWLGDPEVGAYLVLLAAFLPFAVYADAALAATRGFHDMRATVLLDKVARPLAQLALLGGVALTGAAGLLTVAWAGPYLPAALLAGWWLRRIMRAAPPAPPAPDPDAEPPRVDARTFWAFALPRSVASVAQIGIQRSGIVLVAALRGAADAALFTAATRFMVVGQFGTQAIQFAVQPRLAELLAVEDRAGANTLYRTSTAWLICLTWPLYLPAIVYAPLMLRPFGADYSTGWGVLVVVSAGMLVSSACGMSDLVLTMAGRTGWNLVNNLAALVVTVAVSLALIPSAGAVGAALAWAAAIVVRNLLPILQLSRSMGLHPFSRTWLIAVAACLVWFVPAPLACRAVLGSDPLSLAVALALGGAGYAATLWRLRGTLGLTGLLRRRARAEAVVEDPGKTVPTPL